MGITISSALARQEFTKALVKNFRQQTSVPHFLKSFFPSVQKNSDTLSWSTMGLREFKAATTERGGVGNRNTFSRSTENIVLPPYYREYADISKFDAYKLLYNGGSDSVESGPIADLVVEATEKMVEIRKKIERDWEYQCAQMLLTGAYTDNQGQLFDFSRVAGSLVTLSGGALWSAPTTAVPLDNLGAGARFLRNTGKTGATTFDVILGDGVLPYLLDSNQVKTRADIRRYEQVMINMPQANALGGVFQGEVTDGTFRFRLWSYPEVYESATDTYTYYVPAGKVLILPEKPAFEFQHAGIAKMDEKGNTTLVKDQFVLSQYIDQRRTTNEWHIESTGLAVLKAKDQVYTLTVL